MNICCMLCKDLDTWVKTKAKPGDVAYWYDRLHDKHYYYVYKEPDQTPYWRLWLSDKALEKYLEEINKLKIEEPTMNKRCDNCKHFGSYRHKNGIGGSWCDHKEHKGMLVSNFTSCPEHEPKEELTTPFDGVKFYLVNECTGEIGIKYICEDCGNELDEPYHWWLVLPINNKPKHRPGYHFRCEECDKKKEGKV